MTSGPTDAEVREHIERIYREARNCLPDDLERFHELDKEMRQVRFSPLVTDRTRDLLTLRYESLGALSRLYWQMTHKAIDRGHREYHEGLKAGFSVGRGNGLPKETT